MEVPEAASATEAQALPEAEADAHPFPPSKQKKKRLSRRERCEQMFAFLDEHKGHSKTAREHMDWACTCLSRADRLQWYLAIVQRYLAVCVLDEQCLSLKNLKKAAEKIKGFDANRISSDFQALSLFQERITHFTDSKLLFGGNEYWGVKGMHRWCYL